MSINYSRNALKGKIYMKKALGCSSPCITTNYKTKQVGVFLKEQAFTDGTDKILESSGSNRSSLLVVNYNHQPMIQSVDETPKMTLIGFISNAGGILGIFLGISFWSMYECAIVPIVDKLETFIKKPSMKK